jgi:hypothetical protein
MEDETRNPVGLQMTLGSLIHQEADEPKTLNLPEQTRENNVPLLSYTLLSDIRHCHKRR